MWPYLRDPFWCATATMTLHTADYIAEILRGAIQASGSLHCNVMIETQSWDCKIARPFCRLASACWQTPASDRLDNRTCANDGRASTVAIVGRKYPFAKPQRAWRPQRLYHPSICQSPRVFASAWHDQKRQ